jgi:hypothetical protein
MDHVIAFGAIVGVAAGWTIFLYWHSRGRAWSAPWLAMDATFAACVFVISGLAGFRLDPHERYVSHTAWAGRVLWPETAIGLAAAVVAIYLWRYTLRSWPSRLGDGTSR